MRTVSLIRGINSQGMEGRICIGSNAKLLFRSNRFILLLLLITFWTYAAFYVQYYSRLSSRKGDNEAFLGRERMRKQDDHVNNAVSEENYRRQRLVPNENPSVVVSGKVLIGGLRRNSTSYGLVMGPFDSTEDRILEKRPTGGCDENGEFARVVRGRKFVVVLHELTMTGAPISMMELATELLSCEATVSVVVLNKKGGLMAELVRRKINVVKDKKIVSFKTAVEADVVIPGSAVCASWIEQYRAHFPGSQSENIAWWIMENRREYYKMSKHVLNRVKMLIFLIEPQSKEWLAWAAEDNINLDSQEISVAPLSVNDELASVAGISSSSDTSSSSGPELMLHKRKELRKAVREEMGLRDSDVVVMCLGSINPSKGQLLFLESAQMVVDKELPSEANIREVVSEGERVLQEQTLKILIGSLWSKSNKLEYVEAMLRIMYQHPNLSKSVIWTPTTTRVAALYSAADVYVTNSQTKFGETFGRVTIEAMAFGLPVLGTDAGGTEDIVDHNKTGLLHPLRRPGNQVLAQNLQFLLENPLARKKMGTRGREKVEKMYLKRHMLEKLASAISRCMTTI
ncbi:hypothetical protein RHSIM_Rhsim08G0219300 [Rhododendron simsii]|uniref:Glycosyl transferase family 1 domain-containing protein n=1 Tax=Rhododendron simsii TaxID=118357 RepID=A0A834LFT2_RHOSS|nr:hypothetical protein RHSIM_Rhsim08G0219300 [Rhododendron simsii]